MRVSKSLVLSKLPAYTDSWVMVVEDQDVSDIISLIIDKHIETASDYDAIAPLFVGRTPEDTADNLVLFCTENIVYKAEGKHRQTVGSPQAILSRGKGDCKHFASFIGGVLDAISRTTDQKFDWCYCFASYDIAETTPYHVFVIMDTDLGRVYLDPTPGTEGVEPVYMVCEHVAAGGSAVNGFGELVSIGDTAQSAWGTEIPPPHWYPSYMPRFYWQSNGELHVHPLNSVPKYTDNDVLDLVLYYQTIVGYNNTNTAQPNYLLTGSVINAAWTAHSGWTAERWAKSALKTDNWGDGSGSWNNPPNDNVGVDGDLYSRLQARYIKNEATTMPWLSAMQSKGGGIDLMTIPMSTDTEIPRPDYLPDYLPSLFISAGLPHQWPAGSMNTKPKIRGGKSSGYTDYPPTADDVAALLMYAQGPIAIGPTPYPTLWYINDTVNGAMVGLAKINPYSTTSGQRDAQIQGFALVGDMMNYPNLEADPYSSNFSKILEAVVSSVVSYFTSKIPGGSTLTAAAKYAQAAGGMGLTGGTTPANSVFTQAVYTAAEKLKLKIADDKKTQNITVIALLVLAGLCYYYQDDIEKYLK